MQEETTLATEIFKELKNSTRRWFIAFLVMVGAEILTVGGFLWYISLPVDEFTTSQTIEDVDSSTVMQRIGDNYGENETNGTKETAGSKEKEALGD